ncbi:MAG TPA: hypothetical protein VJJ76_01175 [archaeon]|nr:hypothetical protein [archaeon]
MAAKTKSGKSRMRRLLTWNEVNRMMEVRGWQLVTNERTKKEWKRGNEKVSVFKTFEGRWKAEFFYGRRLQDSTGTHDEFFAKVMTVEFAAMK